MAKANTKKEKFHQLRKSILQARLDFCMIKIGQES
jgi:hypothetical protein